MSLDSSDMDAGNSADGAAKPAGKVRLLSIDDLDGRTRAAKFVRDTRARVYADLGGVDRLSTLERLAVENVVITAAMLGDMRIRWLRGEQVDPAAVGTLTNTFNRSASAVGWTVRSRDVTPTLGQYLTDKGKAA